MFWTSINQKIQHLLRILLSYITYESNLYLLLTLSKIILLSATILLTINLF